MTKRRPTSYMQLVFILLLLAAMCRVPGNAQAPQTSLFAAPGDWTVTTYRAAGTGAFLRCSAERHYDDGQTLTIALNAANNFVLGFTSTSWRYEDRSTHAVSVRVDSNAAVSLSGRVRILPVGPIVFVDLDSASNTIEEISAGNVLKVTSADIVLNLDLAGAAAAIASTNRCRMNAN